MTAEWTLAVAPTADDPLASDLVLRDGDLVALSGTDAVLQSVRLALTTAPGTDPLDPSFGFDGLRVLAEETDPELARERLRVAVIAVLRRDPRIRRVLDVRVDDATGPDGALTVAVAFETHTGTRVPATLTTGVQRA